jgi:putative transposase
MECVASGGAATLERPDRIVQGYRRFRCRDCRKQFNERTGKSMNRTQYSSDIVALVVFWRLRYKLSLRDLPEMFLLRGIKFTYEAGGEPRAPLLIDDLRRRRGGGSRVRRSWYVDETYIKVNGRWCYLYRAIDRTGAGRRNAEREPRYGRGREVLSICESGDRCYSGPSDYGWA